ncbi:MAG: hypothetical protein DRJ65_17600 [Acidobacteria bacterium]|nr:MAG: hypothetical protein DRJ65_17600 [Acidobacteriota bacterium]
MTEDSENRRTETWAEPESSGGHRRAIEASEATNYSIFNVAPVGVGLVVDRVFKEVNDCLCSMVGFSENEILGKSARILYPTEEEYDLVCREKFTQIKERCKGMVETRWQRKDGVQINVLLSSVPLIADDTTAGIVFTALDITDRKRTEAALRDSQALLQVAIENLPFDLYTIGADGRYSLQNLACRRHWGNVIGKRPADVAPNAEVQRLWEENNRHALSGETVDTEVRLSYRGRDLVYRNIIAPIRKDTGIDGILGINIDISPRKEAERAQREGEDKYRALADNIPIGIYRSLPRKGASLVSANPAMVTMFGYDIDTPGFDTISVDDLYAKPEDRAVMLETMRSRGAVDNHEVLFKRLDGSTFWGALAARTILGDDGQIQFIDGTIRDITEAKRAQEDLKATLGALQRTLEGTVSAMASMVELRDPYTSGHQRQVAKLASAIAVDMGLSASQVAAVSLAGAVHDVGKIAIPTEILSKPGAISDIEMELIRTHAQAGHDILSTIESPWPIAEIVLQHHERLDGSGYPSGLKGDAIMLQARIMAVADTVEAMVSHRPYRPAPGVDAAIRALLDGSGILFDPEVVTVCIDLLNAGEIRLGD